MPLEVTDELAAIINAAIAQATVRIAKLERQRTETTDPEQTKKLNKLIKSNTARLERIRTDWLKVSEAYRQSKS